MYEEINSFILAQTVYFLWFTAYQGSTGHKISWGKAKRKNLHHNLPNDTSESFVQICYHNNWWWWIIKDWFLVPPVFNSFFNDNSSVTVPSKKMAVLNKNLQRWVIFFCTSLKYNSNKKCLKTKYKFKLFNKWVLKVVTI